MTTLKYGIDVDADWGPSLVPVYPSSQALFGCTSSRYWKWMSVGGSPLRFPTPSIHLRALMVVWDVI